MHIKLRYVHEDVDRHGNVRIYFKRPGERKVRLRGEPGSEGFMAAYHAAVAHAEAGDLARPSEPNEHPLAARTGTLRWLADQWRGSAAFAELDPSTQRARRYLIEAMLQEPVQPGSAETFADYPLERLTRRALEVLRDRKAAAPSAANGRVKALRAILKWGLKQEHLTSNPAADLERLREARGGYHTWTEDEIAAFEARHPLGSKARLAMTLMLYAGARRSDVVRLGRQHVRGSTIKWRAFKNRNRHPVTIELPVADELAAAIAATPTGDLTFLVTEYGRPFSHAGFGAWMKKRCLEAGVSADCSSHGLRKASATRLAEAGATAHQLMAIFGWSSLKEAEVYTRAAERRRMAADGMARVPTRTASSVPPNIPTKATR
ncbi:MAG TPA: tyrosine-type recombinase/integrase [Hyphomicrobiaceae bacterium]|nr:tyrosine-type recombinase/integrase [Hyphomicrobiaceae bacterium]